MNIKAKDLRIGNLIKMPAFMDIFRVVVINETQSFTGEEVLLNTLDGYERCAEYAELAGIPLTEEWLLKLGILFSKKWVGFNSEQAVYSHNEFCIVGNFNDGFRLLNDRSEWERDIKYKYVHQLQNLYFALTGEELPLAQIPKF